MWLFRHTHLADGRLSRYKARLVANDSSHIYGTNVDETFSLTVKPATIQTVLSLATSQHWHVHQLDVKNVVLHGDLSETVNMHQPLGSLLSGGDNKPPMLEKHLYDSWKSIMELYMMNRPHGRMILASVEKGPLVWPTITVDGVTRPKEYTELTPAETIQADCDIKAINIILQGLPTEIYALVSQHRVAKDIWEKIKLLMQGTSLTKQERECKLYDEFDKFTYKKGESLHEYYLRFTLLLNDMNIDKMPLEQF
ncbi:retrovirus-related pol polyprotein from transposon TNT 1-94 [Tanacetum coccineum]